MVTLFSSEEIYKAHFHEVAKDLEKKIAASMKKEGMSVPTIARCIGATEAEVQKWLDAPAV